MLSAHHQIPVAVGSRILMRIRSGPQLEVEDILARDIEPVAVKESQDSRIYSIPPESTLGQLVVQHLAVFWTVEQTGSLRNGRFISENIVPRPKHSIQYFLREARNTRQNRLAIFSELSDLYRSKNIGNDPVSLLFVKFQATQQSSQSGHAAILAYQTRSERFSLNSSSTMSDDQETTLLASDLTVGVVWPHPLNEDGYDIRVVCNGEVLRDKFVRGFLQANWQHSAIEQVDGLLGSLYDFRNRNRVKLNTARIPRLFNLIAESNRQINSEALADLIDKSGIFGAEYDRCSFRKWARKACQLGIIDFPSALLMGKKLEISLRDEITLVGLPSHLDNVLADNGDRLVLHTEVFSNDCNIKLLS